MNIEPAVYLVDDEPEVLKALNRLLRAEGYAVRAYHSPEEFLLAHDPLLPGCAILDMCMPKFDGLALQRALLTSSSERFLIFMTGRADITASVQAMKAGAVDFLTKPFQDEDFLAAVRQAIARDAQARKVRLELQSIRDRMDTLTPREHQVLEHVVAGRLNKQIAADLGITEKTIKVHRARTMEKMGVASLAELVRLTFEADVGTVVESSLPGNTPYHGKFLGRRADVRHERH